MHVHKATVLGTKMNKKIIQHKKEWSREGTAARLSASSQAVQSYSSAHARWRERVVRAGESGEAIRIGDILGSIGGRESLNRCNTLLLGGTFGNGSHLHPATGGLNEMSGAN